jgi:hypothetical protein
LIDIARPGEEIEVTGKSIDLKINLTIDTVHAQIEL